MSPYGLRIRVEGQHNVKMLIADDHAVVRRGLKEILAEGFSSAVFGVAGKSAEVLEQVRKQRWDCVILDINMPDRSGLDLLKELKSLHPRLPVLILSIYPEDQFGVRSLAAGAAGYMTKESAPEELVKAVRRIVRGGKYVSESLAEKLIIDLEVDREKPPHERLSDREHEVFLFIANGEYPTAISKKLSLSVKTVSTYRTRILDKMKMKTNADLIRYAIENHLII